MLVEDCEQHASVPLIGREPGVLECDHTLNRLKINSPVFTPIHCQSPPQAACTCNEVLKHYTATPSKPSTVKAPALQHDCMHHGQRRQGSPLFFLAADVSSQNLNDSRMDKKMLHAALVSV